MTPSLCFHGAHNACTALSWRSHCADDVLKTHLKDCHSMSVQTPWTTTAFDQGPCARPGSTCCVVGVLTACLWWPYGEPTALLLVRRTRAFVLGMLKMRTISRRSMQFQASTGDATALLRWCFRSYCAHLGVLHFSWTPWDRHGNAPLVRRVALNTARNHKVLLGAQGTAR